jgi:LPS-assembly lipoprotein
MPRLTRRHLLLACAGSGLLAGCGFALRRAPELQFRSLALAGFAPDSPLAKELRRQLARSSTVELLADANRAQVVLEAARDERSRVVVASTSAGQVREWQLQLQLDYLLRTPGGEVLLPPTELRMTREMNYTESSALGKEQEEDLLFRSMRSDAVAQLMRRLATIRLPG